MKTRSDAFSIRIFAPAGYDQALQIVEKDNWIGRGVLCRRSVFLDSQKRPEFQRPGVYIIYGPNKGGDSETIYVGEGDPAIHRIQAHYKSKDFWTDLICFTAAEDSLSKSHIQYLESRLIGLAQQSQRVELENGNSPTVSTLSEAEIAYAERFLENILDCLALLRINFFKETTGIHQHSRQTYFLKARGADAIGNATKDGFLVRSNSLLAEPVTNAFPKPSVAFRERLLNSGVIKDSGKGLRFTQDYAFDSPSMAATIICGNPMNGRVEWKTQSGETLKIVQDRNLTS